MNHRNSQKRYYFDNTIVFITTNTFESYEFFEEDIFCEAFIEDLRTCQLLKKFEIFGFKVNPDHIHLLIQPLGKYNYSHIMHNLKRVSSLHIHQIMEGEDIYPRLRWSKQLRQYRKNFLNIYGNNHPFPKFKWQSSFYDHIIRNEKDFRYHISYIQRQHFKHQLPNNKFCFINKKAINDIL